MSKKDKKMYRVLNYIEHLRVLISTVSGGVSFMLLIRKLVFL